MTDELKDRKKWKEIKSQSYYGSSYDSLCSLRKKVIDQMYEIAVSIEEEKNARGCR